MGSRVIDPFVINPGTVMRWQAGSPTCPCTHGRSAACSHEQEADWLPEQVWALWSRRDALDFARNRITFPRLYSMVNISNEPYRLPYFLRICYKEIHDTEQKNTKLFIRYLYYIRLNIPVCRSGDRAS